ncbi:MAG: NrfD/PsrC family molybdoenzyme membrane anchor subunit [Dehalococcoidia bacterium]|nr:NrfD/PsrC family molybdoenzyme membrane anchor subunit [Dehalococcoidia bacterium]
MVTRAETNGLPYGIGRFGAGAIVSILILLVALAFGLYAYSLQLAEGEVVTGMRDVGTMGGAPWGLYIAFELYAAGIGFGSMILIAVVRLSGLPQLRPLSRPLSLLALAALLAGGASVIVDLGQPLRALINLAMYGRPMSPFFGTFTVGLMSALIVTAVYLYLDSRPDAAALARRPSGWQWFLRIVAAGYRNTPAEQARRRHTSLALAILLIVVGATAASTSGFVFGIQQGRTGWYSALQAPASVVMAGVTGTGMLIIVLAVLRRVLGVKDKLSIGAFAWLSNLMLGLTLVYIYFIGAELMTSSYGSNYHEGQLTRALLTGEYAPLFWISAGLLVVSAIAAGLQALFKQHYLWLVVLTALAVNAAAILKRYLMVVPSLTVGNLLPYGEGFYSPTWVEYLVVGALLTMGVLLFIVFTKVFPILDVQES